MDQNFKNEVVDQNVKNQNVEKNFFDAIGNIRTSKVLVHFLA